MNDLLGWQQTRWGMTEAEIVLAVGANRLERIERAKYQNMYADLVVPLVEVGKYRFDVIFQMDNQSDKLAQVIVTHDADPSFESTGPRDQAIEILSEKFGRPSRVGTSDTWRWHFPTTTIDVVHVHIPDNIAKISVRYFPTSRSVATDRASAF